MFFSSSATADMDSYFLLRNYWIISVIPFVLINSLSIDPCNLIKDDLNMVNIPTLRVLKRQVQNPRSSKYVTISLAYQSEVPVDVRWYKPSRNSNLNGSEIPNMLPIQGDELYYSYQLRSSDVYASHLVVEKQHGMVKSSYTAVFLLNNSLQYQVHTHIPPTQVFRRERLYLPDGIQMYVHKTKKGQPAFVECVVKVPNGDIQNDYQLEMLHQRLAKRKSKSKKYKVVSRQLIIVSEENILRTEHWGNIVSVERRITEGDLELKINACIPYVTSQDLGHYKCKLKSSNLEMDVDYRFILGEIKTKFKPVVEFLPCDSSSLLSYDMYNNKFIRFKKDITVVLSTSDETCLRCRAAGPPNTTVAIRAIKRGSGHHDRHGADLDTYPNVTKVMYTDISDIRDTALTYILHYPSKQHAGVYLCYAEYNMEVSSYQRFTIKVVTEY